MSTYNTKLAYIGGRVAAMQMLKLGKMQLEFNSPQEAAQHAKRRGQIGSATGFAGNIGGGMVGGAIGSAAGGPVGGIAGGVAGGMAGETALSAPATTFYDAAHDIGQKANKTMAQTTSRLNAAGGVPTGLNPRKLF